MSYRFAATLIISTLGWVHTVAAQTPSTISWAANARAYRSTAGRDVTLVCPPRGTPGKVWGHDIYTDDSSVCTAAVHAGAITFEAGGTIVLQIKPGQGSYNSTERNGVRSDPWEEWDASFTVTRYVPPPPPPVRPPPPPPTIAWSRTAEGLAPNGRRFTFICSRPADASPVRGTDVYSWDSSICNAAVHAGAITTRGGPVTIEMRAVTTGYAGSERNGVVSGNGERTILGFAVIVKTASKASR